MGCMFVFIFYVSYMCQLYWSRAGLQLVMKWSQHVVEMESPCPLVMGASGIHINAHILQTEYRHTYAH